MGRITLFAVCAFSMTGCAHVQPAQSWAELVQRLEPGTRVSVTDAGGTEVRGRVSSLSASSLTLNVAEALRQFDPADVRDVRRDGDPLWNGLAIGAGVGVLGAALPDNRCSGQPPRCDDKQVPERVTFAVVAITTGIAVDAWRRDRRSLYGAPGRVTLRIIPAFTPHRRSLAFAFVF
jgi:hypothetical protein